MGRQLYEAGGWIPMLILAGAMWFGGGALAVALGERLKVWYNSRRRT